MAFDDFETSSHDGRPVALYEIRWGTVFWRYTSAVKVQQYDGNDFLPVSIRDDGMTQGGNSQSDFSVYIQSDLPIVALFGDSPPTSPVWLTVRRKHPDDPDQEAPVYWVGRIANVLRAENPAEATVRGVSIGKLLASGGLRLTWGKNCPHCIYDSQCKVPTADHRYTAIVAAIQGSLVTFTAPLIPEEGSFTGGYAEWDRGASGTNELRGIEAMIGDSQIKILGRVPGLVVGQSINVYPGCDQTTSTCNDGFDNIDNYGGYPFMPEKSPFDGTQVFD